MAGSTYRIFAIIFLLLAAVGVADSTYLAVQHFKGAPLNCVVLAGCDKVTTSQYATIGSVPVALLGVIYYAAIAVFALLVLLGNKEQLMPFVACVTLIGFLASLWFVYLQLFVIRAICAYCMISAGASTMLFVSGLVLLVRRAKYRSVQPDNTSLQ